MRRAAVTSALLHVVVIAFAFFGLPSLFRPDTVEMQPVAVDLVSLEPETAAPPPKPKPPPPEPKAKPRPPPKAAAPSPIPPPPPPIAEAPEPPPPPPKPEAKPKPKPKPEAKPEPPPKAVRHVPKPKVKPKPPPDRFQALLKNLAKQSQQQRKEEVRPAEPAKKPVQVARAPERSAIDRRRLAAGLAQLVEQQIHNCWRVPGGAKDVQEMLIEVHIRLKPDGTLLGVPRIGDARRMDSDAVYRTVAESAVRALRDPRCSPLRLPYAEYDIWKEITLNFDPRKALGE